MRPPDREVLGLDDSVWSMMQECWGSDPQTRPAIKDVRSFLRPASLGWTPPAPEEIDGLDLSSSWHINSPSSTCRYSELHHRVVHLQVSHFQHIQVAFSSPRGLQQGQERVHLTLHSTEATIVTSTSRPIATVRTPTALTLVPSDPLGTLREVQMWKSLQRAHSFRKLC